MRKVAVPETADDAGAREALEERWEELEWWWDEPEWTEPEPELEWALDELL